MRSWIAMQALLGLAVVASGCGSMRRVPSREEAAWSSPGPAPARVAALDGPAPRSTDVAAKALAARGAALPPVDGEPRTLYRALRERNGLVSTSAARPGDLVFFGFSPGGCGDHVGVIETVERDGRITFRESRGGRMRVSYAMPGKPLVRRDGRGRVINTFLRAKKPDDAPGTRYHAGELLCGVGRAPAPLAAASDSRSVR